MRQTWAVSTRAAATGLDSSGKEKETLYNIITRGAAKQRKGPVLQV